MANKTKHVHNAPRLQQLIQQLSHATITQCMGGHQKYAILGHYLRQLHHQYFDNAMQRGQAAMMNAAKARTTPKAQPKAKAKQQGWTALRWRCNLNTPMAYDSFHLGQGKKNGGTVQHYNTHI